LKRCFGRPEKIIDCDYEFLSKLRTLKEPHDAMPRLVDLLEYLKQPGLEDIWVMLDIKVCILSVLQQTSINVHRHTYRLTKNAGKLDNDTETVMRLIALSIASVSPSPNRPWQSRILLGCWAAKYLPFCSKYLPGFPITHIGISILYASHWRKVLNISFNMLQFTLMTPWGRSFTRKAQRDNRPVFAWTVNAERHMRWDIRHGLDGVITDDPKRFLEIRREWREGMRDGNGLGVLMWLRVVWFNLLTMVFGAVYRYGYGHFNDTGELVRFKASS
jgi:tubulin gamma